MQKDFFNRLWALVRLRYKLIWAAGRTSNGKLAMLFAVYLIGALGALFFALGGLGMGAALGSIEAEKATYFARWMLAGLFVNGVGLSLLFGMGPRAAFSEAALRRYPLNGRQRFFVRQLVGILDPIWLLLIGATLGLAVGFILLGNGSVFRTLLTIFIFIVANYLATIVLLTLVGMAMETRGGSGALGTLVLLLVSFGPLTVALLVKTNAAVIWNMMDSVLKFMPPGAAADIIVGESFLQAIKGLLVLLLWCFGLVLVLAKLESRSPAARTSNAGVIVWRDFYDHLGNLFGKRYAPLISKSLRYHLRCNMVRFSLITAPIIVLAGKYLMPQRGGKDYFFISLAMFFIMSSATAAAMMLNSFGYDEAGIRRYAVWPIRFVEALRATNLASLLLRAMAIFVSFALWLLFYSEGLNPTKLAIMLLTALAALFLYNAAGFWTSVYSPKRMDFNAMWNTRLSFGANVVVIGGVLVPFWGLMMLGQRFGEAVVLRFWWMFLMVFIVCLTLYLWSFFSIEKTLTARREKLLNLIAGANDQ
ncbi:MAG TPA: hypothetical protein PLD20_00070 [Blastocatellia bacterium]|nr:hypothetical protein [Blastocatellia bacterium]HMX27680.1 hypothetical protein [Blastocatellia bacterium]HMZ16329.1 hypothetical protein [Blastocatellia bacterium]HNG28872.1 hypothetical protein [Blastocatellia bacterium]